MVILTEVIGRHSQELMDEGRGSSVLRLVGYQLARLQVLDPSRVPGLEGEGDVIVHGDFGPQNILCDFDLEQVSGVLDWELAHIGSPIEDLAWAEWIVRMHHPEAVDDLPDLFMSAGLSFSWSDRQAAMVRQCCSYIDYCGASEMKTAAVQWERWLYKTEQWRE
jgi:aminoglycoside phosphotransferase